jgi:hypothetical protein
MVESDRASKPRHNPLGRPRAVHVPVEAGRNFHLFQSRKYVTEKVSVLCIFIHHCSDISLRGIECLLRSLLFLLYGPIYVCIV